MIASLWNRMLEALADRRLRRWVRLEETPLSQYSVRMAQTAEDFRAIFQLVKTAEAQTQIVSTRAQVKRITSPHALSESTVLVAYAGKTLVGTMTVTKDSPAGLPLDRTHAAPIDELRRRKARLAEIGSMVVVRKYKGVINLMMMAACFYTHRTLGATHTVVATKRRALPFFRAMYGFAPLGTAAAADSGDDSTMVLVQDVSSAHEFFARHYGRPMATGRLPVYHFLIAPPPCIELPVLLTTDELTRWRMPPAVFKEVFWHRSCPAPNGERTASQRPSLSIVEPQPAT
jgi:hypothetical protein